MDESHHLVRVLRFAVNDRFVVTDGAGKVHLARLTKADPKRAVAEILNDEELPPLSSELPVKLAIGIGIIRPKKFESLLSPVSQLGATEIIPINCKYSDPSYVKRIAGSQFHKRLFDISRNSAKGSLRIHFPVLHQPSPFLDVLENLSDRRIFFADPEGLPVAPSYKGDGQKDILLLIGPEGGFSHREIETMRDMNAIPISLGRTRLRTENATVAMTVKVLNCLGMI